MSTQYQRALARLYALQARGIRLGATRMQAALALRGHPERGQVFVHVGGTNGKGSVSAMIEACLRAQGYRTGLYTSPHLHRYVERVRIDSKPISEREATQRIDALLEAFGVADFVESATNTDAQAPDITFFELTTLLAIEAFRDHKCDVVVLEVGLGGRLDATNAVDTAVSVITRVARDHMNVLGESLAGIAKEKAGILRRGTPAVIGVREPSARRVIERAAQRAGVRLLRIGKDFGAERLPGERARAFVLARGYRRELPSIRIALPGDHQLDNVACAVAALELLGKRGFPVSDRAVEQGLAKVRWPGRLERFPGRTKVLLDAAHNQDGCDALAEFLSKQPASRSASRGKRVLIFGALADKDYRPMLARLAPLAAHVLVCEPKVSRAVPAADLLKVAKRALAVRDVSEALRRARKLAGRDGEIVIAGSIFLVAEARAQLLRVRTDPPIRM